MATEGKIILVTGANRGIGYNIVLALASHFSSSHKNTYIIAARSRETYETATRELHAQLEREGCSANIDGVQLDIADDKSIEAAAETIKAKYKHVNVLVNNAGIGVLPSTELSTNRAIYACTFDTNVTGTANTIAAFLPLLQPSSATERNLVINISSARASLARVSSGVNPPTASIPYSVSKATLNAVSLELAIKHPEVEFQLASPGHCKTAFNGFRGTRDPREGAGVVVLLVEHWMKGESGEKGEICGFWETVGAEKVLRRVPW